MHNILDVTADIKQSPYYSAVMKDFERVQSNINNVKQSRQQTKASLDKSCKDFVDLIIDFRKQMNTVFDKLETKATTETEKIHKKALKMLITT